MAGHRKDRPPLVSRGNVTALPGAALAGEEPGDWRVVVGDLTREGVAEVSRVLSEAGYLFVVERRGGS